MWMNATADVLARLRQELGQMFFDVAAKERDPQVGIRLREIAAAFTQHISHVEAQERIKVAPEHTGLPHRGPLNAVATTGSKVSTTGGAFEPVKPTTAGG